MEKYTLDIAGISMTLLSDSDENYVKSLANELNSRITELAVANKRCSKTEAAMLCALDYLDENSQLKKQLSEIRSQFGAYERDLENLRKENDELKKLLGIK